MPRLSEGLFKYLASVSGVTSLIGSGTSCRLYESSAPQAPTYPFVVFEIREPEQYHQFGGNPTMAQRRFAAQCFAATKPTDADAIADAIYAALMNQETSVSSTGGVTVKAILFDSREPVRTEWDLESTRSVFTSEIAFNIFQTI